MVARRGLPRIRLYSVYPFQVVWADWFDPHGLWSAAPDAPLAAAVNARASALLSELEAGSVTAPCSVALSLAAAPTSLLALIKPQFEATQKHSKHGIIRDAAVHAQVCEDIAAFAASLGCRDIEVFPSPITGGDGNAEFFLGARRG